MDTLIEGIARVAGKTWRCLICDGKTGTFDELDDHMRTEHEFTLGTIYASEPVSWPKAGFDLRDKMPGDKGVLLTFEFGMAEGGNSRVVRVVLRGKSDGLVPLDTTGPTSFDQGMPLHLLEVEADLGVAIIKWAGVMELSHFFNRST